LEDDGSGNTVDFLGDFGSVGAPGSELAFGLDAGEALVDQLNLDAGGVGDLLAESDGAVRRHAALAAHVEWETDEIARYSFGFCQLGELLQDDFAAAGVQMRPRVGQQTQLVGDGDPDAHTAQVDGGNSSHAEGLTPRQAPTISRDYMELRAVRGMKDILPEQSARWRWLEEHFRSIVVRYGYGEVRTPLLEATELFVREIGEGTDVVDKEMYSFERHGDLLTVRPEGTAGSTRAYVQHAVWGKQPVSRWYYIGPMFRAERPAKGRLRQFHQAGCEIYGDAGALCDAEMIAMCTEILAVYGVGDTSVHVNSLGSGDLRARYRDALQAFLLPHKDELSEESQRRVDTNPLRVLDSKSKQDQVVVAEAPSVLDLLNEDDTKHFEDLKRYLDALGVQYVVDTKLVRGLDYYTRTLFELKTTSDELGAQSTLIGGGRYDNMVQSLGGKKAVPGIGFAMGLERILALSQKVEGADGATDRTPDCYLAPMNDAAREKALVLARGLRAEQRYCEVDGRSLSVKAMLRRANSMGSRLCLLLGENELNSGVITVKDLARHEQEEVPFEQLSAAVAKRLGQDG
jgi:histidyl-tRNA synthetase